MNELVEALAPALVVSVALQQFLELLDPVLDAVIKVHKKWILSATALVIGITLTLALHLRILAPLGITHADVLDVFLTALFLTGGTKAFNDLLKLVGYKKEAAKACLTPEGIQRV